MEVRLRNKTTGEAVTFEANAGGVVQIPAGEYVIEECVHLPADIQIEGLIIEGGKPIFVQNPPHGEDATTAIQDAINQASGQEPYPSREKE
jgi:hypothetical protein